MDNACVFYTYKSSLLYSSIRFNANILKFVVLHLQIYVAHSIENIIRNSLKYIQKYIF